VEDIDDARSLLGVKINLTRPWRVRVLLWMCMPSSTVWRMHAKCLTICVNEMLHDSQNGLLEEALRLY
jgi:hypothetical protein